LPTAPLTAAFAPRFAAAFATAAPRFVLLAALDEPFFAIAI
jgi:hypothetical protein